MTPEDLRGYTGYIIGRIEGPFRVHEQVSEMMPMPAAARLIPYFMQKFPDWVFTLVRLVPDEPKP